MAEARPDPQALTPAQRALLAQRVARLRQGQAQQRAIPRLPEGAELPLSAAQERFWFLQQLEPHSCEYNLCGGLYLRGTLDVDCLRQALRAQALRHGVLRAHFPQSAGKPRQALAPAESVDLQVLDLSVEAAQPEALVARLTRFAQEPFDLENGPLCRQVLLRFGPQEHALFFGVHHSVADGVSLGLIAQESGLHYVAALNGTAADLRPLPLAFGDYAAWQTERLVTGELHASRDYWRQQLAGAPGSIALPCDRPRPRRPARSGARLRQQLSPAAQAGLRALCARNGTTPYVGLLALWSALLSRWAQQSELVLGTSFLNRERPELAGLVGPFVNTLCLRLSTDPHPACDQLVQHCRTVVQAAFAHGDWPFERLVDDLAPQRDASSTPLFNVFFDTPPVYGQVRWAGLQSELIEFDPGFSAFDLSLAVETTASGMRAVFEYSTELFESSSITALARAYEAILERAATPCSVAELVAAAVAKTQPGLAQCLGQARDYDLEHSLPARLWEAAERWPERALVEAPGGRLNLGEFRRAAWALAGQLRAQGLTRGEAVGVYLPRGLTSALAPFAVWMAGGAYLPLDRAEAAARTAACLDLAGARLVLGRCPQPDLALGRTWIDPELALEAAEGEDRDLAPPTAWPRCVDPAWVVFTSGSSGQPKGILIPHRALVNDHLWAAEALALGPKARFAVRTPAGFDAALWELMHAPLLGATLVIAPEGLEQDPAALLAWVAKERISVLQTVPALLRLWLDTPEFEGCRSLELLVCGGEALGADLVQRCQALGQAQRWPLRLVNIYGPAEACIDSTWFDCSQLDIGSAAASASASNSLQRVPIGRAIHNARVYLLDQDGQAVLLGAPGEVCIGGPGLADGYVGDAARSAAAFRSHPEFGRLYHTGDFARWRADGLLDFLGRRDQQVKLRGQRLELAAVESALAAYPGLCEVAALIVGTGPAAQLWACVVPRGALELDSLRRFAQQHLPRASQPDRYLSLAALPRTISEKIDRGALLLLVQGQLEAQLQRSGHPSVATQPAAEALALGAAGQLRPTASSALEARLLALAAELLQRPDLDPEEDFFAAGGHSLLAAVFAARVRSELGQELPLIDFFEAPSVRAASRRLEQGNAVLEVDPQPWPRHQPAPASFGQERLWTLDQLEPGSRHYTLVGAVLLDGRLEVAALQQALTDLVQGQPELRTQLLPRDGQLWQVFRDCGAEPIPFKDLSDQPDPDAALRAALTGAVERGFDLARDALWRAELYRLGTERHALLVAMHHAITDGASLDLLLGRLWAHYRAALGQGPTPAAPRWLYSDFAAWQRARLSPELSASLESEARQLLQNAPLVLDLPGDRPRPARPSHRGVSGYRAIPLELSQKVAQQARHLGATPYQLWLASLAALLSRQTGQSELVLGTVVSGRERAEWAAIPGLFANAVPLHFDLPGGTPFREAVSRARAAVLRAQGLSRLPFERLVMALDLPRDASRAPVFQISCDHVQVAAWPEVPGLQLSEFPFDPGSAKLDLSLGFEERPDGWRVRLEFSSDLFESSTIDALWERLLRQLRAGLADPEGSIDAAELLASGEAERLWQAAKGPALTPLDPQPVIGDFLQQVARQPQASAFLGVAGTWTYGQLGSAVEARARVLWSQGLRPGEVLALSMPRGLETCLFALAAARLGAAWLMLDPSAPPLWRNQALAAAEARLTIGNGGLPPEQLAESAARAASSQALALPPVPRSDGQRLAYLVATSGSTGQPKLVSVTERALTHHTHSMAAALCFGPAERVLQRIPPAFDAALLEWYWPLSLGAAVIAAPPEAEFDPVAALECALAHGATTLVGVAGFMRGLLAALERGPVPATFKRLLSGGEQLPRDLLPRLAALKQSGHALELWNLYGPAEACVDASAERVDCDESGPVPIGRALPGLELSVLDERLKPLPAGWLGQLAIAGPSLALGYRGDPEATRRAFVAHPQPTPGFERLYLTGDWAVRRPDGRLDFRGRRDRELKLRGRRLDPSALEAELHRHPAIADAAVELGRGPEGGAFLVAHVQLRRAEALPSGARSNAPDDPQPTPFPAEPSAAQLSAYLAERLPRELQPARLACWSRLPRLASGKLDARALAAHPGEAPDNDAAATLDALEAELLAAFRARLGQPACTRHSDWFQSGGTSLGAIQLALELSARLGRPVEPALLFERPSVARLAAALRDPALVLEQRQREAAQMQADARLPADLARAPRQRAASPPRTVLLTGASGFLGAYLIAALLERGVERLYCHVRAPSVAAGRQRLLDNLARRGLPAERYASRLEVCLGDLGAPQLGLSSADRERLLPELDALVHNGAAVDFLRSYAALRAANVESTLAALQLCHAAGAAFHLVSTIGVLACPAARQLGAVDEHTDTAHFTDLIGGYERTKWVAERLTMAAGSHGLACAIHRPGRILGAFGASAVEPAEPAGDRPVAYNGFPSDDDFAARVLRGCLELGSAPDLPVVLDATPVDFVAAAIAARVWRGPEAGEVQHLLQPQSEPVTGSAAPLAQSGHRAGFGARQAPGAGSGSEGLSPSATRSTPLTFTGIFERAGRRGHRVVLEPYAQWLQRLKQAVERSPEQPLAPLLPQLWPWNGEAPDPAALLPDLLLPPIDQRRTAERLALDQLRCPQPDGAWLDAWVDHLAGHKP